MLGRNSESLVRWLKVRSLLVARRQSTSSHLENKFTSPTPYFTSIPHSNGGQDRLCEATGGLNLLEKSIRRTNTLNMSPNFGSNQLLRIDKELEDEINSIVNHFKQPIAFAFGYGSGVFQQAGYGIDTKPQIDLILAVTDPMKFHAVNMRENPNHYSSLKYCSASMMEKLQNMGPGIYFNPYSEINGRDVKYGIVSVQNLINDLKDWRWFYLAGRLQKPVKILKCNDNRIINYNQLNLKYAATLAKQLTFKKYNDFDRFKFFEEITRLSYLGDVRYALGGENPNKINNIVSKNYDFFNIYYEPIIKDVIMHNNNYLPDGFDLENATSLLTSRIRRSSVLQTIKGVFTAGTTKSIKYAWNKKLKAWKSK
ncbi:hypothetical protein KAFR_0H03410 [Kazachstania africana CBS 2517]|uniref:Phosphatidate cytidylyltransferase, mitochondrial n=1 Tax=Kazachstania africana (strain ATCC 22294 / BCRC 22015 / CBS 2517 / CECT 1963 / NBRC 1671 / NRRL Y-8276) TaxID=1071382 RepID=H2AYH4_KAZAF|nr:hypothetical protein KAFR_0H03410 [Kazachstania africana CBS 2517]CCF59751.1 hypothetical protein KAFR_0H03410 [Kazachstania africana CBS 2517]